MPTEPLNNIHDILAERIDMIQRETFAHSANKQLANQNIQRRKKLAQGFSWLGVTLVIFLSMRRLEQNLQQFERVLSGNKQAQTTML